jgi:tripartite-type tricarboxylate transporter receptor subunit TctC
MQHPRATRHGTPRALVACLVAGMLAGLSPQASAQAVFPARPVTMVVGFAPGGGTDLTARIIAKKLAENIGQNVVVENRPGAGGIIAADYVARATPDGHTILLAAVGSIAVAPHQNAKLPYDPLRDLAPVTMAVVLANVLVVNAALPVQSVADYIRVSNARPGGMNYGSSGVGGAGHLAGELFRIASRANITHVPYKGGGPAMADLLGGQIASVFATAPSAIPHIKTGKIRAIATTGLTRSSTLPDVPTIAESGFPGFEATNWFAYVAPGKTPKPVIERLNRELVKVLTTPEIREQLLSHGMEAQPGSSEELARYIEREYATWGRVVREAGIQAE